MDKQPSQGKRYYRTTSSTQRKLLFEIWEESNNVSEACRRARVSRATFYYWKSRFAKDSYAGLEKPRSHAPHNPAKISPEIADKIIEAKKSNPTWGRVRISHELMKKNNWKPLVSASTVRRVLISKGMMPSLKTKAKRKPTASVVRHAEKPGQTANVDLCFVPAEHQAEINLPTVSGSSGKLKIARPKSEKKEWPGQVFNKEISYEAAMDDYVAARDSQSSAPASEPSTEEEIIKARKRELKTQEEELRIKRRSVRAQRKQEDEAWRRCKKKRREEKQARKQRLKNERRAKRAEDQAREEIWKAQTQIRREQAEQRKEEDRIWRDNRNRIREQKENVPVVTVWIAILVIVDNCTRQCIGLPMFTAGSHVTAEMVVNALKELLPDCLQYLIADRGIHFTSRTLEQLAKDREFTRVFLAPHRPQSNGIAERYVRTLKEWLLSRTWETPEDLAILLAQFFEEYNDRPHQGRELNGLSPNEYSKRMAA